MRRAVLFDGPDRVPRDLPEPWGSDFLHISPANAPTWKPGVEGEDEWGCVWRKLPGDKTMGQVVVHPFDDYAKLDAFPLPDYDVPSRYETARLAIVNNADEKFALAYVPVSFIHRLEYLRGHAEAWTDPYDHPDELRTLLSRMADIAIDSIRHFAAIGADGIISADDWGLQDRPMVSPNVFGEHFKPHYERVYGAARDAGLLCFLHSCGYIIDLLDDLVDAGLQVIQQDQQENMGVDNLAARFGGRLCFWCPVDIQQTMVHGSLDDIGAYARTLIDKLGRYNGGFIAKWYPAPEAVNHRPEAVKAMCEAFAAHGQHASVES